MNRVILVGNLTRDVDVRFGKTGIAIGKTGIATNRRTKTQSGEQRDEVMFIDLTIWGKTAEMVQQYFRKGSKILVEGRLSFDQWTDQSGMKRSKHSVTVESIEFVDSKGSNNSGGNQQNYNNNQNQQNNGNNYGGGNNGSYGNNNNNYGNSNNGYGNNSGGGYPQQQNSGYNNQQPAPQNSVPPVQPQQENIQSKQDDVPSIDIDDMDDQVPF